MYPKVRLTQDDYGNGEASGQTGPICVLCAKLQFSCGLDLGPGLSLYLTHGSQHPQAKTHFSRLLQRVASGEESSLPAPACR